ncbi:MAG: cbb3-type cytochrome c oxidase subunit 3, partial [Variovorax sp.]
AIARHARQVKQGQQAMDLNDIRSLVTVFSFLLFGGLAAWAWWPSRRSAYEAAARLPLDGEAREFDR